MSAATSYSLPGIDLERLLSPISEAHPTGIDLRQLPRSPASEIEHLLEGKSVPVILTTDSEGRQVGSRDETALARGVADGLKRAVLCLTQESKDLEVAALCVRGLLGVHGFRGLACGLQLLRELHVRFGNTLYPNPPPKVETLDDYGEPLAQPLVEAPAVHEYRVLALRSTSIEKVDHAARALLRLTPLFQTTDGRPCRIADWETASEDSRLTPEDLSTAVAAQDSEVFVDLAAALEQGIEEAQALQATLRSYYARPALASLGLAEMEAPPLSPLIGELRGCLAFVTGLRPAGTAGSKGKERAPTTSPGATPANGRTDAAGGGAPSPPPQAMTALANGRYQPKDRAEALSLILASAQFLQRHEPLSPLPRLLFRLILWARSDSLRPFLEDVFRTSGNEQEQVFITLALEAPEHKLASERLPGVCPFPQSRPDALAMLADAGVYLQQYEPLSPLSYFLAQLLTMATAGSPRLWLEQAFATNGPGLQRICTLLGLPSDSSGVHATPTEG